MFRPCRSMPTNESPLLNEKARLSRVDRVSLWCWIHASASVRTRLTTTPRPRSAAFSSVVRSRDARQTAIAATTPKRNDAGQPAPATRAKITAPGGTATAAEARIDLSASWASSFGRRKRRFLSLSGGAGFGSVTPAVRDRRSAVAPERLRPQAHARRGLAPLVLGAVDHRERAVDDLAVAPVGGQLLARAVELDVRLEHAVEYGVRRQRVLVELRLAQLRARRPLDDRLGDQLASSALVQVAREPEHVGLEDVLDQRQAARDVAVERRVADGELRLVPGRDHEPAELVGERHEQRAADPRLQVLLRQVRLAAAELGTTPFGEGVDNGLDRQLAEVTAEALREPLRVR